MTITVVFYFDTEGGEGGCCLWSLTGEATSFYRTCRALELKVPSFMGGPVFGGGSKVHPFCLPPADALGVCRALG